MGQKVKEAKQKRTTSHDRSRCNTDGFIPIGRFNSKSVHTRITVIDQGDSHIDDFVCGLESRGYIYEDGTAVLLYRENGEWRLTVDKTTPLYALHIDQTTGRVWSTRI